MLRISDIKVKSENDLLAAAAKKLGVKSENIKSLEIIRKSLDARKRDGIFFVYTVDVEVPNEGGFLKYNKSKNISKAEKQVYSIKKFKNPVYPRPVVVGFGPAGMFAALILAEKGLAPIVVERGKDIFSRTEDTALFWQKGILNPESNVQFGEGGAGAFSDGKLTTRIKDELRVNYVLNEFVKAGAPAEIKYLNKPHIGTDKLKSIVYNIRRRITSLGGEVRFSSRLDDIIIENGKVTAVKVNGASFPAESVILATGHSARDIFKLLYEKKAMLVPKPFAVGVRIEHRQSDINLHQYGDDALADVYGAADYKLTYTTSKGRGVYTFCMCPGGSVIAASSEKGGIAVNGMSLYSRNGENANSALLVQAYPDDFGSDSPLAGIAFQRSLEQRAFSLGGGNYSAPAQRLEDFMSGVKSASLGKVKNTYRPEICLCDLNNLLPAFVCEALKEAIPKMSEKLKGFNNPDALLTAVESRSSSPVRIMRDKDSGFAVGINGLYPAGEGSGYSGGIISSAVDGIIAAEKAAENLINSRGI